MTAASSAAQPTTTWMGAAGPPRGWRIENSRRSPATPYQAAPVSRATTRGREATKPSPSQLLFSYKVHPQTVVLVGYADNHSGLRDVSLTQTDRTFFLKLGYAWVP